MRTLLILIVLQPLNSPITRSMPSEVEFPFAVDPGASSPLTVPSEGFFSLRVVLCRVGGVSNHLNLSYVIGQQAATPVVGIYSRHRMLDPLIAGYVNRTIERTLFTGRPLVNKSQSLIEPVSTSDHPKELPGILEVVMPDAEVRVGASHTQVLCYSSKHVVLGEAEAEGDDDDDDDGGSDGQQLVNPTLRQPGKVEDKSLLAADEVLRDLDDPSCIFLGDSDFNFGECRALLCIHTGTLAPNPLRPCLV